MSLFRPLAGRSLGWRPLVGRQLGSDRSVTPGQGVVDYDYYVDSAAAGGDGLSPATAFNTVAALKTAIGTSPNKRVGIKYGSVLDETWELLSSNTGTIIDAYGNPADGKPLWRCDDAIAPGDFTLAAGRTNVYAVNLTVETDALAAEWPSIWEDGVALALSAVDLSANEGRPGTFWHGTVTDDSTITLYVRPYGSTNPTSDGKEYRAAIRKGLNSFAAEDVTIRHQQGRRNYTSYGSITGGRGCLIEDCDVFEGNTHNIYARPGKSASGRQSRLVNVLARDATRGDQSATLFVVHEATPSAGSSPTLTNCRAEKTYNNRKTIQDVEGVTSASPGVVTITGHSFANADIVVASDFTGPWAALNGMRFVVASATANAFNLQVIQTTPTIGVQVNYSTAALAAYAGNGGKFRLHAYDANVTGFLTHTGGTAYDSLTYQSCSTLNCGASFAGSNTTETSILDCSAEQFNVALNGITGIVRVSRYDAENSPPIVGAVMGRTGGTNGDLAIDHSTFRLNTTGNFQFVGTGQSVSITDCTLIGFNQLITCNVLGATLEFQRNDCVPEGRSNSINIGAAATDIVMTSDFNDFNGASATHVWKGAAQASLAAWTAASGQDANSTP